jgi:hypothetical protein
LTAHAILDATLAKIAFGRNILFDLSFTTNYSELKNQRQKVSDLNVDHENSKRMTYDYKVNDLILFDCGTFQRKLVSKRDGFHQVVRVYSNVTLKICKGIYIQYMLIH